MMDVRDKSDGAGKIGLGRILSIATLLIAVTALLLALKKPQPVAPRQSPAAIATNAQSFQAKVSQLEQAQAQGQTGSEVHLTADEIGAAIAQAERAMPALPAQGNPPGAPVQTADPSAAVASSAIETVSVDEPIITFEGDIVRGQFVTEVAGKKTYVTVAGHLGSKNGYATFEPTEFKVGDLKVPVSLVNDALQKKMLEQQDRLKLPDFVSDVRVENGELVVKQK
jgi:hypothetical protein